MFVVMLVDIIECRKACGNVIDHFVVIKIIREIIIIVKLKYLFILACINK